MYALLIYSFVEKKSEVKCETKKDNNKAIFDVHFSTREEVSESFRALTSHIHIASHPCFAWFSVKLINFYYLPYNPFFFSLKEFNL